MEVLQWTDHHAYCLAFSHDGKLLAVGGRDGAVGIWNVTSRKQERIVDAHTNVVSGVCFLSDSKSLVTGSWDGTLKWWDVMTGRMAHVEEYENGIDGLVISADGLSLAIGATKANIPAVILADSRTGLARKSLEGQGGWIQPMAFSADGSTLAVGVSGNVIKISDLITYQVRQTLTGHKGQIRAVAITFDRKTLASGSGDGSVKLWDTETGKLLATLHYGAEVNCLAISPDGRTLVASGKGESEWFRTRARLRFWEVITAVTSQSPKE
jgi:WD40 repeat protein